jgi:hypothetical protein
LASPVLLLLAVSVSIAGMLVARSLRGGYVRTLEASMADRAQALDVGPDATPGLETMLMESWTGIDMSTSLHDIRLDAVATAKEPLPGPAGASDPEVAVLVELRSGDAERVRRQLRRLPSLSAVIADQVITLLAWDDVAAWASLALVPGAPALTGQLVDRLLDPAEEFTVRRRIPRILAAWPSPRAQAGLLAALGDPRFEVRFQAARALSGMHERQPALGIDRDAVIAAVLRETDVEAPLWEHRGILDEPPPDDPGAVIEPGLGARGSRSLEHVFTLLSLMLPRAPLRIAFKGLLTTDAVFRGTSLEYLESVLPHEVWNGLLPHLGEGNRGGAGTRSGEVVLDELLRSSRAIDAHLSQT